MEVVTGALPSVVTKLGDLLAGEYNLQKGLKGEIRFLQSELESMQGALQKVSNTPVDELDIQDKIWARDLRELSYDIEDSIDVFMVRIKGGNEPAGGPHGISKFIDRSVGLFRKAKIRHKIAAEIREIKSCVDEVAKRHDRYKINGDAAKAVRIDPRIFARYENLTNLVGIDEARGDVVKILMDGDEVSEQQEKIVSLVGFGGLGKTTLANVVYEMLRAQFDCSAFVSVSQTPDMEKLFQDMFSQLTSRNSNGSTNAIDKLRKFLQTKRYFIVIDDIWDISVWKMIRCALVENNRGCKIITTTRILNVAEHIGGSYKLKSLSLESSRILFYRRICGNEHKNRLDVELVEVSDRILKKCAGVPLAIIAMASLLASKGRNKMEWYEVYNSIGAGIENNLDVENMRKILLLSYYYLPSYLKTCFLYLSVFPEDSRIDKDRLIWMWIAEGFIKCEKQGKSSFKLGESYFNELINKSMIQPLYDQRYYDIIDSCQVHDMILDLIRLLSSEENFVTILNDVCQTSPLKRVRRLSLQSTKVDHDMDRVTMNLQQVRSVVAFPSGSNILPAFQSCRVLRVLDLESYDISQGCSLKYVGNLFHLRFLGLRLSYVSKLPEEIGNLRFLQTLSILMRNRGVCSLPTTIVELRNLMCLRIRMYENAPNLIGSLTSLEELSSFDINSSTDIEELGHLVQLRKVWIGLQSVRTDSLKKSLVECLNKLQKIQVLAIVGKFGGWSLDAWVGPPNLCRLELRGCRFTVLPTWMNPSFLLDLHFLRICVEEFRQEDLETLGMLPALSFLRIEVIAPTQNNLGTPGRYTVGACSFPCLLECKLYELDRPLMFQEGAMPKLITLKCSFPVRAAMREITAIDGGFDLGLRNLASLGDVTFYSGGVAPASSEEYNQVRAYMKDQAEMHPNHPALYVNM